MSGRSVEGLDIWIFLFGTSYANDNDQRVTVSDDGNFSPRPVCLDLVVAVARLIRVALVCVREYPNFTCVDLNTANLSIQMKCGTALRWGTQPTL